MHRRMLAELAADSYLLINNAARNAKGANSLLNIPMRGFNGGRAALQRRVWMHGRNGLQPWPKNVAPKTFVAIGLARCRSGCKRRISSL